MTTTPRSKKPARATPPPLPPAVDIDAIAARVTEVTNNIMSTVIKQRDCLIVGQQDTERNLKQAQANVGRIESDLRDAERSIAAIGGKLDKKKEYLERLMEELKDKITGFAGTEDAKVLALIGQEVYIAGGNQRMVAGGLNEAGEMTCVYEQTAAGFTTIMTVDVPPLALRLAPPVPKPINTRRTKPA